MKYQNHIINKSALIIILIIITSISCYCKSFGSQIENDLTNFVEYFKFHERTYKYIMAFQIPFVTSIAIICFTAYKLGLKHYWFLCLGWGFNVIYLFTSIISLHFKDAILVGGYNNLIFVSKVWLDLIPICLFYFAIRIKKDKIKYVLLGLFLAALFAGYIKIAFHSEIQSSIIKFNYIPAALFDGFVLFYLAEYFRNEEKINKLKFPYLSLCVYIYAFIQILAIFHNTYVMNIGFLLGLVLKFFILIFISKLIVYTIKNKSINQLNEFSKASKEIVTLDKNSFNQNKEEFNKLIIESTLQKLMRLLKKDLGYFAKYIESSNEIEICCATSKYMKIVGNSYNVKGGLISKSLISKKIEIKRNLKDKIPYMNFKELSIDTDVKSAISIPFILDSKIVGFFFIESETENSFTDLEENIVDSLVHHTKEAISNYTLIVENIELINSNSKLVTDLEINNLFIDSLKNIDREMVKDNFNSNVILDYVLSSALKIMNCSHGNIDLIERDELICIASTNPGNINHVSKINNCLSGLAVSEKCLKYFPDLDQLTEKERRLYKPRLGIGYKCELIIPLVLKEEVIGVINLEDLRTNVFSEKSIEQLETFAGQTSIVIYITSLIDEIRVKNQKLEKSIEIDKINLSFALGDLISHRIGNSIGGIRTAINDHLLPSQKSKYGIKTFGIFSDFTIEYLKEISLNADKAIFISKEIPPRINQFLTGKLQVLNAQDIENIFHDLSQHLIKSNIRFSLFEVENTHQILINDELFKEVFRELLLNAQKAVELKKKNQIKEITISVKIEDNFNVFIIQDNGCGFDITKKTRIFEKGISEWPKGNSSGKGLAIIKEIINYYFGKIEVKSKINKGTQFYIYIPIHENKN